MGSTSSFLHEESNDSRTSGNTKLHIPISYPPSSSSPHRPSHSPSRTDAASESLAAISDSILESPDNVALQFSLYPPFECPPSLLDQCNPPYLFPENIREISVTATTTTTTTTTTPTINNTVSGSSHDKEITSKLTEDTNITSEISALEIVVEGEMDVETEFSLGLRNARISSQSPRTERSPRATYKGLKNKFFSKMTRQIQFKRSREPRQQWPYPMTAQTYFRKFRGHSGLEFTVRKYKRAELFWTFIAVFIGISLVAVPQQYYADQYDVQFVVGSFGAMAVLIYAAPASPLGQPRNAIIGHAVSGIIGVSCYKLTEFGCPMWLATALSVSLSITAMQMTGSLHPPGAATAIIAVLGPQSIHDIGYLYVLVPVEAGVVVMLAVALVINNLSRRKFYPIQWWNKSPKQPLHSSFKV